MHDPFKDFHDVHETLRICRYSVLRALSPEKVISFLGILTTLHCQHADNSKLFEIPQHLGVAAIATEMLVRSLPKKTKKKKMKDLARLLKNAARTLALPPTPRAESPNLDSELKKAQPDLAQPGPSAVAHHETHGTSNASSFIKPKKPNHDNMATISTPASVIAIVSLLMNLKQ